MKKLFFLFVLACCFVVGTQARTGSATSSAPAKEMTLSLEPARLYEEATRIADSIGLNSPDKIYIGDTLYFYNKTWAIQKNHNNTLSGMVKAYRQELIENHSAVRRPAQETLGPKWKPVATTSGAIGFRKATAPAPKPDMTPIDSVTTQVAATTNYPVVSEIDRMNDRFEQSVNTMFGWAFGLAFVPILVPVFRHRRRIIRSLGLGKQLAPPLKTFLIEGQAEPKRLQGPKAFQERFGVKPTKQFLADCKLFLVGDKVVEASQLINDPVL